MNDYIAWMFFTWQSFHENNDSLDTQVIKNVTSTGRGKKNEIKAPVI